MTEIYVGDARLHVPNQGFGPALLLVHGFPLDHTMWRHQIRQFAGKYKVVAPDLRGFGASDISPGVVTMEDYADDMAALLDALRIDKVVFCGLSMGGYIGFQFAKHYPDRLAGLILCDTRAVPDTPEAAKNREALAAKVLKEGTSVVAEDMMKKLFAPGTLEAGGDEVASIRAVMENARPEGVAAALHGLATRPDSRELLGQIEVPTLVIVGEHDVISPPDEMKAIADAIPGAEFLLVEGAGHMAPLEKPEAVNAAIGAFLEKHVKA
jgi:3-oxoadipate enol-lactonase